MIGVLKKIWDFAGEEQGNIRKSMILGFFYAVFHMFQIAAIYVVVLALVGGSTDSAPAWQALGLLLASILGGPQPLQPAPADPRRLLYGGGQAHFHR